MQRCVLVAVLFTLRSAACCSLGDAFGCSFRAHSSNGSTHCCRDERCNAVSDLVTLLKLDCCVNRLSLRFTSSTFYWRFIAGLQSNNVSLSAFFCPARPNVERRLQVRFDRPLDDAAILQLDHLAGGVSQIDTLHLTFDQQLSKRNEIFAIDAASFVSNEHNVVDTLLLTFSCAVDQRVRWQLTRSAWTLPASPCPRQIRLVAARLTTFTSDTVSQPYHWLSSGIAVATLILFI
jgi:hypothetical protein